MYRDSDLDLHMKNSLAFKPLPNEAKVRDRDQQQRGSAITTEESSGRSSEAAIRRSRGASRLLSRSVAAYTGALTINLGYREKSRSTVGCAITLLLPC